MTRRRKGGRATQPSQHHAKDRETVKVVNELLAQTPVGPLERGAAAGAPAQGCGRCSVCGVGV